MMMCPSGGLISLVLILAAVELCFLCQVLNDHFIYAHALIERWNMPQNSRNSSAHALERPVVHTTAHQFLLFPHAIALCNALPPQYRTVGLCFIQMYSSVSHLSKFHATCSYTVSVQVHCNLAICYHTHVLYLKLKSVAGILLSMW